MDNACTSSSHKAHSKDVWLALFTANVCSTFSVCSTTLQTNVSVCTSLCSPYMSQMMGMAESMLQLYRMYSEMISKAIVEGGPHAARSSFVKYMRGVKKNTLRLIEVGTQST